MLLRLIILLALVLAAILGLPMGIFESYTWLWAYPLLSVGFIALGLLIAFAYLAIVCGQVDMDREQEDEDPFYRQLMELYVESILSIARVNVKTSGMDKVPKEGRFLLVCNHCSNADPVLLLHVFAGRQLAFISKKENRKLFIIGPMMHKLLCQLLDRENDREALKTIIKCIRLLKEDKVSIGVFPEGGIDKEERKLHHFRPGVFKIAQKAQVPIVVCALKNSKNVLPNLVRWRHTDVELNILEVIPVEDIQSATTTELADRAYRLMAEDLGPENVAEE